MGIGDIGFKFSVKFQTKLATSKKVLAKHGIQRSRSDLCSQKIYKVIITIILNDPQFQNLFIYRSTGGGPPPSPISDELEKIEEIYGRTNPILDGMSSGFDSLEPSEMSWSFQGIILNFKIS